MCTLMRLFASVYTLVDSQSRPLDELLVTTWMIATMRPDTTMDSFYLELA